VDCSQRNREKMLSGKPWDVRWAADLRAKKPCRLRKKQKQIELDCKLKQVKKKVASRVSNEGRG